MHKNVKEPTMPTTLADGLRATDPDKTIDKEFEQAMDNNVNSFPMIESKRRQAWNRFKQATKELQSLTSLIQNPIALTGDQIGEWKESQEAMLLELNLSMQQILSVAREMQRSYS